MCDPVSIGSMAVGAAGSLVNGYERSQSANAMTEARNAATRAELERSKKYGGQSRGEFDKSLAVFDPAAQAQGLQTAQGDIGAALTRNAPTDVGSITTTTAPKVVGDSENSRLAGVFSRAADQSSRTAKLKGYDQQRFNDNLAVGQQGRSIDMIGDFARTSAGVNQVEQRAAAQNAYRPPSGLGDLMQFAGTVGGYYGGRGGNVLGAAQRAPSFAPMTSAGAIH